MSDRYRRCMPQSFFIFDFGTNEEAAQQARHKIDGWRQGFRLGDKMLLKFEREEGAEPEDKETAAKGAAKGKSGSKKPAGKDKVQEDAGKVRLFLRLSFSDHEKLSHQRWLDRIPAEEPFKSAQVQSVRAGDPEFPKTAELFDSLD
jgi:hypothetical protein